MTAAVFVLDEAAFGLFCVEEMVVFGAFADLVAGVMGGDLVLDAFVFDLLTDLGATAFLGVLVVIF